MKLRFSNGQVKDSAGQISIYQKRVISANAAEQGVKAKAHILCHSQKLDNFSQQINDQKLCLICLIYVVNMEEWSDTNCEISQNEYSIYSIGILETLLIQSD